MNIYNIKSSSTVEGKLINRNKLSIEFSIKEKKIGTCVMCINRFVIKIR